MCLLAVDVPALAASSGCLLPAFPCGKHVAWRSVAGGGARPILETRPIRADPSQRCATRRAQTTGSVMFRRSLSCRKSLLYRYLQRTVGGLPQPTGLPVTTAFFSLYPKEKTRPIRFDSPRSINLGVPLIKVSLGCSLSGMFVNNRFRVLKACVPADRSGNGLWCVG